MTDARPTYEELEQRLATAEQTLEAITTGAVDALVVAGEDGPQVYSLDGADAFYRVLVEQMPVGAATVRRDGSVLYANSTFAAMLDIPAEVLVGANLRTFAVGAHRATLLALLDGAAESGDVVLTAGAREIEAGLSVRRVERGTDDIVCVVAADLTARRLVEDELRRARTRAEQASLAKNAFLSQMSHELRTPLNVILGFCQLLELDALTGEQRESVEGIASSGELLLELIVDVLEFSRIESGDAEVAAESLEVAALLEEAARSIRPLAVERGVSVGVTSGPAGGPHVRADRRRLRQILLNLLSNAVKYNREGGSVLVRVDASPGGPCRITVADTGTGVADADRARLFTPFERLGAERRGIQGTGLGLALSRSLAESMGGRLELAATGPEGSAFVLELPDAAATSPPLAGGGDDAAGSPGGDGAGALRVDAGPTGLVLYVEDNPTNIQVMRAVLRRRPGVELVVAETAAAGLLAAIERVPDLVLLDRQLPDEPGDVLLERLRRHPRTAAVPVVIVTADANAEDAARLLARGACEHLTKPLDVRRLLGVVDRLCPPRGDGPAAA